MCSVLHFLILLLVHRHLGWVPLLAFVNSIGIDKSGCVNVYWPFQFPFFWKYILQWKCQIIPQFHFIGMWTQVSQMVTSPSQATWQLLLLGIFVLFFPPHFPPLACIFLPATLSSPFSGSPPAFVCVFGNGRCIWAKMMVELCSTHSLSCWGMFIWPHICRFIKMSKRTKHLSIMKFI